MFDADFKHFVLIVSMFLLFSSPFPLVIFKLLCLFVYRGIQILYKIIMPILRLSMFLQCLVDTQFLLLFGNDSHPNTNENCVFIRQYFVNVDDAVAQNVRDQVLTSEFEIELF